MRTINDYFPVLQILLGFIADKTEFRCDPPLEQLLKKHARLIGVFSHSTPLSWVPVMALLGAEMKKAGGGERVPLGIMDRFFYDFALLRPLARWVSQSTRPLGFGDLAEHFESFANADLCVFPEGSNCFFGDPNEIQNFRSPRILELSIRNQIPIILGVHRGSEHWAKSVHLPGAALVLQSLLPNILTQSLERANHLTLPVFPKKMPLFRLHCELYFPQLKFEVLAKDRRERRAQLEMEASRMRDRMIAMLAEMDAEAPSKQKRSRKPEQVTEAHQ